MGTIDRGGVSFIYGHANSKLNLKGRGIVTPGAVEVPPTAPRSFLQMRLDIIPVFSFRKKACSLHS